jgi:hypothetical protein
MVSVMPLGTYTYPLRIHVLSLVSVLLDVKLPSNTVSTAAGGTTGGTIGGTTRSVLSVQEKMMADNANKDNNFKCFITDKIVK